MKPPRPIRKSVTVPIPPGEAFRVFTRDLDRWWPVDTHSIAARRGETPRDLTLDPWEGGRIVEVGRDGRMALWATVTDWQPGKRLALAWHVGRDPEEATDVTLVFTPTEGGTRVDLDHRGFDRLGGDGAETAARYDKGWDHVMGTCFQGACGQLVH